MTWARNHAIISDVSIAIHLFLRYRDESDEVSTAAKWRRVCVRGKSGLLIWWITRGWSFYGNGGYHPVVLFHVARPKAPRLWRIQIVALFVPIRPSSTAVLASLLSARGERRDRVLSRLGLAPATCKIYCEFFLPQRFVRAVSLRVAVIKHVRVISELWRFRAKNRWKHFQVNIRPRWHERRMGAHRQVRNWFWAMLRLEDTPAAKFLPGL